VAAVGILIIDDDVVNQRALKSVLDSEGWHVRISPLASEALEELASGQWSLVIANVSLTDLRGPLFTILKELAQADDSDVPEQNPDQPQETSPRKRLRVLFIVPLVAAKTVQPLLEREGLPYALKPYHLHDFLEKVSELLVEAGAITEPIRSIGEFSMGRKRQQSRRAAQDSRRGAMFASREDYQMTEEEMAEFERQEEEERKKREKELREREHL
jgi:PleD family two-component response regulator